MCSFDSNVHIHKCNAGRSENINHFISDAMTNGIDYFCNIFSSGLGEYRQYKSNFAQFDNVIFAIGFQPADVGDISKNEILKMHTAIENDPKIKALGEIGLDFSNDKISQDKQRTALVSQLNLLKDIIFEKKIPVIINSKNSEKECLKTLVKNGFKEHPVIFSNYSGSFDEAKMILEHPNFYISISGKVSTKNKNSADINKAIKEIWSNNKLLIETNTPFSGKSKNCNSCMLKDVGQYLAKNLHIPEHELFEKTTNNSKKLFNI